MGIVAGYAGGWVDQVLSRLLDILWAFPVYLLAISLSVVLISARGCSIGPWTVEADSLLLPIANYRDCLCPLCSAAGAWAGAGAGAAANSCWRRWGWGWVASAHPGARHPAECGQHAAGVRAADHGTEFADGKRIVVFCKSACSRRRRVGGAIIADGQTLIYVRPLVAIAPGVAIVVTVLALNVLGRWVAGCVGSAGEAEGEMKQDKAFFFAKTKQKTFVRAVSELNGQKFFGSFLQKRTAFLMLVFARLAQMLFVLFGISVLVFLIFFATPGADPAARIAGRNATPEVLAAVRHDFGLDQPMPVQYALMMKQAVRHAGT